MNQEQNNRADALAQRILKEKDWPLLVDRVTARYFDLWRRSTNLTEREDVWHEFQGFKRLVQQLEVTNGKLERETRGGGRPQSR